MGRPKKNRDLVEKEIMNEMSGYATETPNEKSAEATVAVLEKPEDVVGSNEFNDISEYTIQVIADNGINVDPTTLPNKDPNFEYYFIRDDHKNIAKKTSALLYQMGGWQIVPKEHSVKKCGISEKMLAPDGSYRIGELILCFMPKTLYAKKRKEEQRRTNERMESVNILVQGGSPDIGSPHPDMLGIQAGKMDGGRVVLGTKNKGITRGPLDHG